jgi:hypothetical protein
MSSRTRATPQIARSVERRLDVAKLQEVTAKPLSNAQLADHVGKLVAGELQSLYEAEDLSKVLPNLDEHMLRISWG